SAIQQARESAKRTACCNNLKQLALACNEYQDSHGEYPIEDGNYGPTATCYPAGTFTWPVKLCPYINEPLPINTTDPTDPWYNTSENYGTWREGVVPNPKLLCPTRRTIGRGLTDYATGFGGNPADNGSNPSLRTIILGDRTSDPNEIEWIPRDIFSKPQ